MTSIKTIIEKAMITHIILSMLLFNSCTSEDVQQKSTVSPEDISTIVIRHNYYRSEVGVGNIEWSDEVAKSAQNWANQLAVNCVFKHSNDNYGENIWKGTANAFTTQSVIDSWASEKANYNYEDNSCNSVCGHYTQIVWANTTKVGCAKITCNGSDTWVCQYDPPGNYVGQKPY